MLARAIQGLGTKTEHKQGREAMSRAPSSLLLRFLAADAMWPPPHTLGPFPPHHDERVIKPWSRRKPSPFSCFWSGMLLQQWEMELKQPTTHTAMQRNPVIANEIAGEIDTPKWLLEKLSCQKAVCEPSQAEPLSCQKLGQRLSLLAAMSGQVRQMHWSCWIVLCLALGIWYWAWWLALRVTLIQSRHTWEKVLEGNYPD